MENTRENLQMHQAFFAQDPPDYEAYLLDPLKAIDRKIVTVNDKSSLFRDRLNGE